jgi:Uncharacterised nucleotidyltransferase
MDEESETESAGIRLELLQEFVARVCPGDLDTAHLEVATAEVLGTFEKAGIDALLLKGPALATLLYRPGEGRRYSDVDLLVPPGDFGAAGALLADLGYLTCDPALGIDDVGNVMHGQTWIRTAPGPIDVSVSTIDLHRWLPGSRAAPSVTWQALAKRRTWIEVGDRRVAVLDRAGQAMHLALHAAQHGPAFERHVDELELALERWTLDVWRSAMLLATEAGATEAFAAGLRLVPHGRELAAELALPASAELEWTIRHRHIRPRGTFHLQALTEADGLGQRLDVLRRSLLPSRAWIIRQHPWAGDGVRLIAAYGFHLMRAPAWAARAWLFRRQARRARAHN